MKRVLLLYPKMLFYKVSIFNKLEEYLRQYGYELIIWYTSIEDENNVKTFKSIEGKELTIPNFVFVMKEYKIDFVINILFKSDPGYLFYIYIMFYTKFSGRKIIFYGHGINKQRKNFLNNSLLNLFYFFFDGIILYTPNEKKMIWSFFHKKITIAYNALDIDHRKSLIKKSKAELKNELHLDFEKIILTTGRLQKRKKIDLLAKEFIKKYGNSNKICWLLVGPELDSDVLSIIKGFDNIFYLNSVYDEKKISELFYISDVYCVPGALGIGIVEAIYWGLPIVTLDINHGPEAYYLRNKINGYYLKNIDLLIATIDSLLTDEGMRLQFGIAARNIYKKEGNISKMFSGFKEQLERFAL